MGMAPSNRAANGQDDWMFTADGKKYFILGESLNADKLPMPNYAQVRSAMKPKDFRYVHHGLIGRLVRNPWLWIVVGLFAFAIIKSW